MYNILASEVAFLKAQKLGHRDLESTTVALKVLSHQCGVCYISSGQEPAIPLMRHMSGYIQLFLNENSLEYTGQPYVEQKNVGAYLILLDLAVKRLEESVVNSARGDAIGQVSVIMSILQSCMTKYGVEPRPGFGV